MQENINKMQENVSEYARKVWDDSRSNLQKVEKDVSSFIKRFVDDGKIAPIDAEKIMSKLSKRFEKRRVEFEHMIDDGSRWTLHQISVPTKDEIDKLSKRIDQLSRRIGTLKKGLSA